MQEGGIIMSESKEHADKLIDDCLLEMKQMYGQSHYTHFTIAKTTIIASIDDLLELLIEKDNQYYYWIEVRNYIFTMKNKSHKLV